ncbi:TPA: methionyl-tRNA formyltransferase [Candidatus Bipolaricaulota bacterium]|nr:methionyl-tRNA formyltransferase [Candidatus Bipolaricaulota bacterium]
MKLIFIGSGEIGVPTLRGLAKAHEILAVFTRPDRPAGRGQKPRPTPIKETALELGLPLYQPESVNSPESLGLIRGLEPELIVVAAYGEILSKELLAIPGRGAINLHASLLPKYRGAAPIQWAIIRGEQETGITTFLMDEGMDTGEILLQRAIPIEEEDTAGSVHDKLAEVGMEVMLATLEGLERGTLKPRPQDHSQATYAPKIEKDLGRLDWSRPSREIFNLIRGLNPSPGAFTFFRGKRLKVHRSRVVEGPYQGRPGEVVGVDEGFTVKTGDEALELVEVQPEGKRRMSGPDFIRGYRVELKERLGE